MMGSDARDMMGLPSAGPAKPATPKVPKPKVKGPSGMAREVLDLNFEGAPPISIVAPKFKEKPKLPFKPRRWEQTPFMNSARRDGLILHHWKREGDIAATVTGLPVTPADSNAASEMDTDDKPIPAIADSAAAKWNVKIERPKYSDEEYETHLKSDDWSREETDYLIDLAVEFDLRWIVIGDRYDYQPPPPASQQGPSDTVAIDRPPPRPKFRSMEDLKARYYAVAAKCMTLRTPLSSMSSSEFDTHEKMTKFDPKRETLRKKYAEQLFHRSAEDAHEEELLLKELSRIVLNQEKLFQERKALYDRLEAPPTNQAQSHASTTIYQSSQGLAQLMQSLLQSVKNKDAERKEKRRSALGIDTENVNSQNNADSRGQRNSLGSSAGIQDKRQPQPTPQHRPLSHAERMRFGVTYPHERLTSGIQFRHERVVKASQAKSAVQTTRISDALAELGIPARLFMPTAKVVTEYERLVEGVKSLVEVRKLREKVDGEIKVWEAQRGLANGDGAAERADGQEMKNEEGDAEGERNDETEQEQRGDGDADVDDTRAENEEDEEDEENAAKNSSPESEADKQEGSDGEDDAVADVADKEEGAGRDAEGSDASGEQEDQQQGDEEEQEASDSNEHASQDAEPDDPDGIPEGPEEAGPEEAEPEDDAMGGDDSASTRTRSMRKRSASVISAVSNKSSKRQRK
ncbi:MAG: hypothetical protein Q9217_003233 [Psora testacea]